MKQNHQAHHWLLPVVASAFAVVGLAASAHADSHRSGRSSRVMTCVHR